jgi:uncharacterized ubiquitin-like protein YukD
MDYLLVTLNYSNGNAADMKIPASMSVEEFVGIICEIYNVSGSTLQAEPPGIMLNKKENFSQQGVGHGAMLTLHD